MYSVENVGYFDGCISFQCISFQAGRQQMVYILRNVQGFLCKIMFLKLYIICIISIISRFYPRKFIILVGSTEQESRKP